MPRETIIVERANGAMLGILVAEYFWNRATAVVTRMATTGHAYCINSAHKIPQQVYPVALDTVITTTRSIIHCGNIDFSDQCQRLVDWYRQRDHQKIPKSLSLALDHAQQRDITFAGLDNPQYDDGSHLCRVAPIAIFIRDQSPRDVFIAAALNASLTHGSQEAQDSAKFVAWFVQRTLSLDITVSIRMHLSFPAEFLRYVDAFWHPAVAVVLARDFEQEIPAHGTDYGQPQECLYRALWSIYRSNSFEQALTNASEICRASDTVTLPLTGLLAGSFYGQRSISTFWYEQHADIIGIKKQVAQLLAK